MTNTLTRPAARMILPAGSDRTDRAGWLKKRRELGLGASEAPVVLGYRWKERDQRTVYHDKVDDIPPDPAVPEYVSFGLEIEAAVIAKWARVAMHGEAEIGPGGELWQSNRWPRAIGTPDARTRCPEGNCITDGKAPNDAWRYGTKETPLVPAYVEVGMNWHMFIHDLDHSHVAVLLPDKTVVDRTLLRNERVIRWAIYNTAYWWGRYVTPRVPPPATDASLRAVEYVARNPLGTTHVLTADQAVKMTRIHELNRLKRQAEKDYRNAKAELLGEIPGDATTIEWPDGLGTAATWQPIDRIAGDTKDWRRARPDLVRKYGKSVLVTVMELDRMVADYGARLTEETGLYYPRTFNTKGNR